ncbi:MAG: hypothetical protein ACI9MD_002412, partial [Psychrobacter glaciei]
PQRDYELPQIYWRVALLKGNGNLGILYRKLYN